MTFTWADAAKALRMVASGAKTIAPLLGKGSIAEFVVTMNGEAMDLAADLIDANIHPITYITRIRSSIGDFDKTTIDLENYALNKQ